MLVKPYSMNQQMDRKWAMMTFNKNLSQKMEEMYTILVIKKLSMKKDNVRLKILKTIYKAANKS